MVMLVRGVSPSEAARKGERVFLPREGLVPPNPPSLAAMGQQNPRRETLHLCADDGAPTHRASPPSPLFWGQTTSDEPKGQGEQGRGTETHTHTRPAHPQFLFTPFRD